MKILLSHGYFLEDDAKEKKIMRPYPPLGILYISGYLDQHNIPHNVFDTTFSSRDRFEKMLLDTKPEIVGLYTNLMTKVSIISIIQFIKTHIGAIVILGGPDTRSNAENYLHAGADYLVIGEGEQSFLELVKFCQGENGDRHLISGIAFLENGNVVKTPEREKIKDLDSLPLPNRSKIDFAPYLDTWKKYHGKNAMSISTMRGCPYTCKWCSRGVYGLSYRRRSAKRVVEELKIIQQQYNPDTLWFVDDVFTISHKWLQEFHDELKKQQLKISYECISRADRMNENVVRLLKESGCFRIWIGAESGSQKIIDLMDRRVDVAQVREMILLSKKFGIETGTFIMLGYPGETMHDIRETIDHLKRSDPDYFTITVAYPIKGTELYEEVESVSSVPDWNVSTDRDIDFKRKYSRKFYDHAVRWVVNEVNYQRNGHTKNAISKTKHKIRSMAARAGMWWEKNWRPTH